MATPSLAQPAVSASAAAATATATLAAPPTATNLLIAVVKADSGTPLITGWARRAYVPLAVGYTDTLAVFDKIAGAGESASVTATAAGASRVEVHVYEATNTQTDATLVFDAASNSRDAGGAVTTRSAGAFWIPTSTPELVIAAVATTLSNGGLVSWDNSFTAGPATNRLLSAYLATSASGNVTTSATYTTSRRAAGLIVAYRSAGQNPTPAALTKPKGIGCLVDYTPGNTPAGFQDVDFTRPGVSFMVERYSWNEIEVNAQGDVDWTELDYTFGQAELNGLKVVLIPVSGYGTPDWALAQIPANLKGSYPTQYGHGRGTCQNLPCSWSDIYKALWKAHLTLVAQRYGNRPSFVMIAVTGPTSVSAETSLPNSKTDAGQCQALSDVANWKALNYRPSVYLSDWSEMISFYKTTFPNQYLSVALHAVLDIDENQQDDATQGAATRASIVALFDSLAPNQSAIQTSGMNAGQDSNGQVVLQAGASIVQARIGLRVTGFQCSSAITNKDQRQGTTAKFGDATDINVAFQQTIDIALNVGAINYLQLYVPDCENAALDKQRIAADTWLKANP